MTSGEREQMTKVGWDMEPPPPTENAYVREQFGRQHIVGETGASCIQGHECFTK